MKSNHLILLALIGTSLSLSAQAEDSMLRITCEGDDVGAKVYINGKFKGECPVDMKVQEGMLKLRVQKPTDSEHLFEQEVRMGGGVVKKIEVKFPEPPPKMIAIPGKNYEIGAYEVTQGQWKAIMNNNPSEFQECGDNCPVEQVSWDDVQEFLLKLNAKTGKQYRLPTKVEWEYACYGGNNTGYCGSNDINAVAWYGYRYGYNGIKGNSNKSTHPVGLKQPNGFGLYDMIGNVWEWVQDEYNGDPEPGERVILGGSWFGTPGWAGTERSDRTHEIGFRLARTLP